MQQLARYRLRAKLRIFLQFPSNCESILSQLSQSFISSKLSLPFFRTSFTPSLLPLLSSFPSHLVISSLRSLARPSVRPTVRSFLPSLLFRRTVKRDSTCLFFHQSTNSFSTNNSCFRFLIQSFSGNTVLSFFPFTLSRTVM